MTARESHKRIAPMMVFVTDGNGNSPSKRQHSDTNREGPKKPLRTKRVMPVAKN